MELELFTGIVEIKESNALDVFTTPAKVEDLIARIKAATNKVVPNNHDVTTEDGRSQIASLAFKVTRTKTAIEKVGEQLAKEAKDLPKKIDAGRKKFRDDLESFAAEIRAPVTAWEDADEKRKQVHLTKIDSLKGYVAGLDTDQETIRGLLAAAEAVVVGPECEEFEDGYRLAKENAVSGLATALAARVKYDADQAELAALREKQRLADEQEAERLRLQKIREREELVAQEAADKARREQQAAARAEIDAANARAAAVEREASARRDRVAAVASAEASRKAQEAEEARRREASKLHRQKIGAEAAAALMLKVEGLTEKMALDVVRAIAKKEVPHLEVIW